VLRLLIYNMKKTKNLSEEEEILWDKDMMSQIRESEKNIKKERFGNLNINYRVLPL